jgi:prolyl 4-hydroxylase
MKLTILLIVIIVAQLFYLSKTETFSNFKNSGFAKIEDPYKYPVVKNNLVTKNEAEYIIKKASESFTESKVVSGLDESVRKSQTTWIYKSDPVVGPIIRRLCESVGVPLENAEPLQVVKYSPGGYYNEHHDSCCDPGSKCNKFIEDGGQRILTILIYLL